MEKLLRSKIENMSEGEAQEHIKYAISAYGFLMPSWEIWRTDKLAEKVKETYDCTDNRNMFYYLLLLLNSHCYSPFQKLPDGRTRQI